MCIQLVLDLDADYDDGFPRHSLLLSNFLLYKLVTLPEVAVVVFSETEIAK